MSRKVVLFHSHFDRIAGIERTVYNLLKYLSVDRGMDVSLLLASPSTPLVLSVEQLPIRILFLNVEIVERGGWWRLMRSHVKLFFSLKRKIPIILGDSSGHIAVATSPYFAYMLQLIGKSFFNAVISWEHFSINAGSRLSFVFRKFCYRKMHVVTLTDEDLKLVSERFKPISCICIPNAVPFEPKQYISYNRLNRILAIGRLTKQKGFDLLLKAYSQIEKDFPDWQLHVVGDDYGELENLKRLKTALGLTQVSFLPASVDIEVHYSQAAFFVLSSRFEGLPMVVLEAMAYGLPIVAFDCPTGPRQLVGDDNGFLVPPLDVLSLARYMRTLIMNPNLLRLKADGSEKRILAYKQDKVGELWLAFISRWMD